MGRCLGELRRNSVHERPKPASRGRFSRSVYTPAYPRLSATVQQCTQVPRNGPERPFLPICVHSCVAAHGEGSTACSRARRAAGRETPGQAARPRRRGGCRTTCSPRRGIVLVRDDPGARPVGSPCEAFPSREAERLASRLEARHTSRHVSRQLTEQGHPARAISPKPARACICWQRRSRSPQRPSFSR